MVTFDELRRSRDRLIASMQRISNWEIRARTLLHKLEWYLDWQDRDTLESHTALLLQELNRELGENEEANDVQGR